MILEDEEKCEEMANVRRRFLEQGGTECVNQIRGFITEVASKCSQDEAPACQDFLWSIFTCGEHMVSKATHRKRHGDTAENARSDNIIPDWYAPLIQASRSGALLWAGFWDGDESGRGTLQALEDFARMVDHDPVHPNTYVGRAVRNQDDFQSCFKDGSKTAKRAMHHFWTYTSFAFVTGMAMRDQRWVIAIVNKPMEGERALQDSVLALYEAPSIGAASHRFGWRPLLLVIDLLGTCSETMPLLVENAMEGWQRMKYHYGHVSGLRLDKVECIPCPPPGCSLNRELANQVTAILKK